MRKVLILLFSTLLLIMSVYGQEANSIENFQVLQVDFNLDGIHDVVEGETSDSLFIVSFITFRKNGATDTLKLKFELGNSSSQDAFCGNSVKIEAESLNYDPKEIFDSWLPGFRQSENGMGVKLSDGMCDSFHFYWNLEEKRLEYWRL